MEDIGLAPYYRYEVSSYLHLAYFASNRVNMMHLAKVLYMIPPRIRYEGVMNEANDGTREVSVIILSRRCVEWGVG